MSEFWRKNREICGYKRGFWFCKHWFCGYERKFWHKIWQNLREFVKFWRKISHFERENLAQNSLITSENFRAKVA